jgi:2-polyprenyl-3-methyl-5-hydroxy-6-metoxy-1,4-benzoquinol methylase
MCHDNECTSRIKMNRNTIDLADGCLSGRERLSLMVANLPVCPLCASADVKIYMDGEDQRLTSSALGSSRTDVSHGRILRCQACSLGFRQMRPGNGQLSRLYYKLNSKVYDSELRGRLKTAARHLRIVHRYLSPSRLLDVGCASGIFLRSAADAGWTVVGVEPSEALCAKARQILLGRGEVICATLQEACLPVSSFDAVTLWDILEHVPDPFKFMCTCVSLLRPGGYLFVNVPDLDSLQARVFGPRWPLYLLEHLNYFNRKSLALCGTNAKLTWLHFGQRSASFSIKYVLYRLTQHHVPGASLGQRLASWFGIGDIVIPVRLGELYAVSTRDQQAFI